MMHNRLLRKLVLTLLAAALTLSSSAYAVQSSSTQEPQQQPPPSQQQKQEDRSTQEQKTDAAQDAPAQEQKAEEKKDEKKEGKKEAPQGTPVLWQEPADISSRNLLLGSGGDAMKPDLSRVAYQETLPEGYSVKWRVRDGAGKEWVVKIGNEAQPETAATRLVWAAGYPVEVTYLVPCVKIENAPKPQKQVKRCEGKGYANVRFEARPEGQKRLENWSWDKNPFVGTKEFAGLVVLMGLVNNWDLKDSNNKVIYAEGSGGGELRYVVSDLGATFGKTGNFITHSRNEPKKYVKTGFVEKVEGDRVRFDYNGKKGSLFENITVEQAKWIGDILAQLTEEQVKDAFRAANYTPEEVEGLAQEVLGRINALHSLPAPTATAAAPGS